MNERRARPSVLVFATGGTIGMHETPQGLAPDPDFADTLELLVRSICEPLGIDYRINHMSPPIDSANANAETAPRIARLVRARVRTSPSRGVVIVHGTDTLAFTGARLALELADLRSPVVLTGSQLPHGAPESDARPNLSLAIRASVRASRDAPVSIAFGGELLPAVRATKSHASLASGFSASRPLAESAEGVPRFVAPARHAAARVISFRFVPGTLAEDLRAAVGASPDGLVLECYGSGNAPMARHGMREVLSDICERMPVVAVTQCAGGSAELGRYAVGSDLAAAGVIGGADMTLEAALAKLSFALDSGFEGVGLRALFEQNLVGEQTA